MTDKFLVIAPAWVGDMVLAQSLFKLLKQRHPSSQLDVLAPAWTLPLLERMPEVDEPIALEVNHGEWAFGKRWRLGRALRRRHYDRAIVLPNSWKSALVPFAARVKRRTGYVGELRYGLLNDTRRLDESKLPRTVDRFLALGLDPEEPWPSAPPAPALVTHHENMLHTLHALGHAIPQVPVLALCPGAEYGPAKRWPAAYYAEVARAKLAEGWEVWLFGSRGDAPLTREVQRLSGGRCLDLGGRTTLAEAIDLLAAATVVVTNDSGLMHVAAALGRPVIALYGSSDPRHTPPLSDKARILYLGLDCSPCFERDCPLGHLECLRGIPSRQVLEAISAGSG